jgi:hypothetical protein
VPVGVAPGVKPNVALIWTLKSRLATVTIKVVFSMGVPSGHCRGAANDIL